MLENESNSFSNANNNYEHQWKELLYNLFYEIKSEIVGKKIEIDEDEYQQNVTKVTIPKLINYIHDSIQILITTKIEISKRQQKDEDDKYYMKFGSSGQAGIQNIQEETIKYENIIRKLEEKERILYRSNFYQCLQKEAMINKIGELMEIEDQFEEMKEKFKYEEGRFLDNERKDNEIVIIRRENSILKNTIKDLENRIKIMNDLNEQLNAKIIQSNEQIKDLRIKIEEKQAKLNLSSNYFQNINNISMNNSNSNTKGLINSEENVIEGNDLFSNKLKTYVKLSTGKRNENEHNNTVKYFRNQNMILYKNQFNKAKPKILSYKKKHEVNNTYNEKKSTKNTTNNDIFCSTRNEFTERLNYKFFSGNNAIKNNNIVPKRETSNRNSYGLPMNNSQVIHEKYSYLFNKKNIKISKKINNIYSIKKILAYGSANCSRPNSTKKIIKKNSCSLKRSSSHE